MKYRFEGLLFIMFPYRISVIYKSLQCLNKTPGGMKRKKVWETLEEKIVIKITGAIKSSRINKEDIVAHTIEELSFETAIVNLKAIKMF